MPYRSTVLADSPIAFYPFDDSASGTTARDLSTNALTATFPATYVTPGVAGIVPNDALATAFRFGDKGGQPNAVTAPRSAATEPASALSIEFWLKSTAFFTTYTNVVTGGWSGSGTYGFALYMASGKFFLELSNSARSCSFTGATAMVAATTYHVVVTVSGTTASLYLNGALADTKAISGSGITGYNGTTGIVFGDKAVANVAVYGTAQDFAVYSSALSATQVTAHYNAGVATSLSGTTAETVTASDAGGTSSITNASSEGVTASDSTSSVSIVDDLTESLTAGDSVQLAGVVSSEVLAAGEGASLAGVTSAEVLAAAEAILAGAQASDAIAAATDAGAFGVELTTTESVLVTDDETVFDTDSIVDVVAIADASFAVVAIAVDELLALGDSSSGQLIAILTGFLRLPLTPATTIVLALVPAAAIALPITPATMIALPLAPAAAIALRITPATTIVLPVSLVPVELVDLPLSPATSIALRITPASTIALPIASTEELDLPIAPRSSIALPLAPAISLALPLAIIP